MLRRDFLRLLLASPLAMNVDVERFLWVPNPRIVVPAMPLSLYGVPYHCFDGSTRQWLGFIRAAPSLFERDDMFYRALKRGSNG